MFSPLQFCFIWCRHLPRNKGGLSGFSSNAPYQCSSQCTW